MAETSVRVEMRDCQATILTEIASPEVKQMSIAKTYWFCLRTSEKLDFGVINKAIIARWSIGGLNRIKKLAHSGKCFEGQNES